ncbi:MAG: NAD(P)/FAD-dependent oxidoreductase [Bacteroidales bacterium]|nr:NAD(P)/FAD-dependent oxidoreductase [Bacteroidales bacterium]
MKKAVIIGSGLGGLECGVILSKEGYDVTVLEKEIQAGGCLQGFRRGGFRFDTGFHYVGGIEEGGPLHPLFRYFDLLDLPWVKLDEDCFDEVVIGGERFPFAMGYDRFIDALAARFPSERAGLEKLIAKFRNIGDHIFDAFKGEMNPAFAEGAWDFLCSCTDDPLLRKVLSGTSLKLQLDAETLPLYVFAQISNSFIRSSHRLTGGGPAIVDRLASQIDGEVRTGAGVSRIIEKDGAVVAVGLESGERIEADVFISDIHPTALFGLLGEDSGVRKIYRRRISSLENSCGMFTANILLKEGALPYLGRNIFVHTADEDPWGPVPERTGSVMIHFYPERWPDGSAKAVDLLSPMRMSDDWDETRVGHRGEKYLALKESKAAECLDLAETGLPGLKDAVEGIWTSTPLTWRDYTATESGSAYGIMKDWRNPLGSVISPRTPVQNLFLTGQNLNLHGILGTSMTSFLTAGAVLGRMPSTLL